MIIGVPKEIKTREYRVGLVPGGAASLVLRGHTVLIERGAGIGSGISDEEYVAVGAQMVDKAADVWSRAEMVIKVKEPLEAEYPLIKQGQTIYTYFHLAAVPSLAKVLLEKKVSAVAYETIQTDDGALPLLKPMSEVAGRMAVQIGAVQLEREHGGKGILLPGVPGVRRGKVVILGGGVVGTNAAKLAVGMGAQVTVLDVGLNRLAYLDDIFGSKAELIYSDRASIDKAVRECDLLIGAVLIPGAKAPKLVSEKLVSQMSEGSVIVDVAVDQGGCIETVRPTTHDNPTYMLHGVVHYCVANMPGAVSQTSTFALNNATIQYGLKLADLGVAEAVKRDRALALGVNTLGGHCTYRAVAEALDLEYLPLDKALAAAR
jgi:alanine dehydrogenase